MNTKEKMKPIGVIIIINFIINKLIFLKNKISNSAKEGFGSVVSYFEKLKEKKPANNNDQEKQQNNHEEFIF